MPDQPDTMYGQRFDCPLEDIEKLMKDNGYDCHSNRFGNYAEYLIERCRRAEEALKNTGSFW